MFSELYEWTVIRASGSAGSRGSNDDVRTVSLFPSLCYVFFYIGLFRMVTPAVPFHTFFLQHTILQMKKFSVLKFLKNVLDWINHSDQGKGNILARSGSQIFMGWVLSPPDSYVEVLTPQYLIMWLYFGDRVFKEVIKVKLGHLVGP